MVKMNRFFALMVMTCVLSQPYVYSGTNNRLPVAQSQKQQKTRDANQNEGTAFSRWWANLGVPARGAIVGGGLLALIGMIWAGSSASK